MAAAQSADLLYLQHLITVHAPVRGARFLTDPATANGTPRPLPHLRTRGQPAPHHRIHADILVFAQPHDHNPPGLPPSAAAGTGGTR